MSSHLDTYELPPATILTHRQRTGYLWNKDIMVGWSRGTGGDADGRERRCLRAPFPCKGEGRFPIARLNLCACGFGQPAKLGVIYVLESVLRILK